MPRVKDEDRKYTSTWQVQYTHYEMNEIELCYFAALIDGLRLINECAEDKGISIDKLDSGALVDYVQRKGVQIYKLQ